MIPFIKLIYPWSKWQDVTLFGYGGDQYLLQGRIHLITGRKQFAVRSMKQWWRTPHPHAGAVKNEQIQFKTNEHQEDRRLR